MDQWGMARAAAAAQPQQPQQQQQQQVPQQAGLSAQQVSEIGLALHYGFFWVYNPL